VTWSARLVAAVCLQISLLGAARAQVVPPAEAIVSFDRDVRPILRKRCGTCHNPERPRGELDLTTFAALSAGGSSGQAAVPGRPEDSPLYTYTAHLEDPHMPPNAPKLPQREVDVIRSWIEGGMAQRAGDGTRGAGETATVAGDRETTSGGLVAPAAPAREPAVTALAVSPTAPIAAVSSGREVLLYELDPPKLLGALAFTEGDVFALHFSRVGQTLLVAGGVGAVSGKAVLYRVGTWERAATLGDESDVVLSADLAPDDGRLVIGGPGRVVKVLTVPGGEVVHTFRQPTDWVTAAAFSPDGLLVAAGDRFGGLFVRETRTGDEFLTLRGHTRAITAIDWTPDGDGLVTAGEDGIVQVWDMHTGKVAARWDAHQGGVLGVAIHPASLRVATCGRDRRIRVWEITGTPLADLGPASDQATRVAWKSDGGGLLSGDWAGEVLFWDLGTSSPIRLPRQVAQGSARLTLVSPELAPARAHLPAKSDTSMVRSASATPGRVDTMNAGPDDLRTALAAAREAAAAAERTAADLGRILASGNEPARTDPVGAPAATPDALTAARSARDALKLSLKADPGNDLLARALEQVERAIAQLEARPNRPGPGEGTVSGER
jgi:hypothetical protein